MKDIEKAKSKSDDVVQKYKLLKDDTLIFSHQSVQSKFQKVRVCDVVEIAPVVIPNFLLESVLEVFPIYLLAMYVINIYVASFRMIQNIWCSNHSIKHGVDR